MIIKELKITDRHLPILCPIDDIIGKSIQETGWWEKELSEFFIKHIQKLDEKCREFIFLDIGAHVGYFSSLASAFSLYSITYSFEPNREIFNTLFNNLCEYDHNLFHPINFGLSKECCSKDLYCSFSNTGNNSEDKSEAELDGEFYTETCNFIPVDMLEIMFNFSPDQVRVIKIDTQGTEAEILRECFRVYEPCYSCGDDSSRLYIVENSPGVEDLLKEKNINYKKFIHHVPEEYDCVFLY